MSAIIGAFITKGPRSHYRIPPQSNLTGQLHQTQLSQAIQRADKLQTEVHSLTNNVAAARQERDKANLEAKLAREQLEMVQIALSHALVSEKAVKDRLDTANIDLITLQEKVDAERKAWEKERKTWMYRKWFGSVSSSVFKKRRKPSVTGDEDIGLVESLAAPNLLPPTTNPVEASNLGILLDCSALDGRPPSFSYNPTGISGLFPDLTASLEPEIYRLHRGAADLQRGLNASIRRIHAEQISTQALEAASSPALPLEPFTQRNLQLIVALYDVHRTAEAAGEFSTLLNSRAPQPEFDCSVCMETMNATAGTSVEACGHTLCKDCLTSHIKSKLGDGIWPVSCPVCVASQDKKEPASKCSFHISILLCISDSVCPPTKPSRVFWWMNWDWRKKPWIDGINLRQPASFAR